jgi:hypothetical protein
LIGQVLEALLQDLDRPVDARPAAAAGGGPQFELVERQVQLDGLRRGQALPEDLAGRVEPVVVLGQAGELQVDLGLLPGLFPRLAEVVRGPLAVAETRAVPPPPHVRPIVVRRRLDHRVDDLVGLGLVAQLVAEQRRPPLRGLERLRCLVLDRRLVALRRDGELAVALVALRLEVLEMAVVRVPGQQDGQVVAGLLERAHLQGHLRRALPHVLPRRVPGAIQDALEDPQRVVQPLRRSIGFDDHLSILELHVRVAPHHGQVILVELRGLGVELRRRGFVPGRRGFVPGLHGPIGPGDDPPVHLPHPPLPEEEDPAAE